MLKWISLEGDYKLRNISAEVIWIVGEVCVGVCVPVSLLSLIYPDIVDNRGERRETTRPSRGLEDMSDSALNTIL